MQKLRTANIKHWNLRDIAGLKSHLMASWTLSKPILANIYSNIKEAADMGYIRGTYDVIKNLKLVKTSPPLPPEIKRRRNR